MKAGCVPISGASGEALGYALVTECGADHKEWDHVLHNLEQHRHQLAVPGQKWHGVAWCGSAMPHHETRARDPRYGCMGDISSRRQYFSAPLTRAAILGSISTVPSAAKLFE